MLKKLELEALQADISSVDRLLSYRNEQDDPIGFLQFSSRKLELAKKLSALNASPDMSAGVALFFGGDPVLGSKGIRAQFAGKAIEAFQDLVSKKFATTETGTLGQRGPIPLRSNTELMLTDVARGSFGLVLEEINSNDSLTRTDLHQVVDEVTNTIIEFSAPEFAAYESALETIDSRLLVSLRDFFKLLDEENATIRLVEGEVDASLDSVAIHRARNRTDFSSIDETESDEVVGRLFILPAHRRFELIKTDTGETLYGTVSADVSKKSLELLRTDNDVVGKVWRTKMRVRETVKQNQEPKFSYTLLELIGKVSS